MAFGFKICQHTGPHWGAYDAPQTPLSDKEGTPLPIPLSLDAFGASVLANHF